MHARICKFASLVLVVLCVAASACEDASIEDRTSIRVGPLSPSGFQSQLFSVEPATLRAEFLTGAVCGGFRPFRTRFNIFMRGDRDLFLRRFRFVLLDPSGRRAVPAAFLTSTGGGSHSSMPVPIPTMGDLPIHGMTISPFGRIGVLLNFDCGFRADGTLVIDVESADGDGAFDLSQIRVPVG